MAQHRPRKPASVEYTTDEEDTIVYDMGEEIESPKNGSTVGASKKDIAKYTSRFGSCAINPYIHSLTHPPDYHMGNLDRKGDSLHIGTGIVLYQMQLSLLVVLARCFSLKFLCVYDEGSIVGQSLV
ncbi:hypothetical protein TNCV_2264641 [Trichonephila clavipes]|nr:hypothetical protein TNCV_2264641 [Trichonephila clavipes]